MGILKGRNCSVRSTCERWMTVDCERRNSCLRHRRHSPTCVCAPGHREFSAGHQPCRWPGELRILSAHTLGSSSQTKFILPAALFNSAHPPSPSPSLSPLQLHGHRRMHLHRLSLFRNNRVFFGSHFPFFRVPHPASDNQLHRPQRAATCWNWEVLILRIGGSQTGGASSIKPASRARLQILLPSLVLCSPRVPP